MSIVRQWVAIVVGAYLLGILGWCVTGGLRNEDHEPIEEVIGRTLFMTLLVGVLVGGVVGLVWYDRQQSNRKATKISPKTVDSEPGAGIDNVDVLDEAPRAVSDTGQPAKRPDDDSP